LEVLPVKLGNKLRIYVVSLRGMPAFGSLGRDQVAANLAGRGGRRAIRQPKLSLYPLKHLNPASASTEDVFTDNITPLRKAWIRQQETRPSWKP